MGKDHKTAAREGTDEIGLAVMATTFAIVAVFVPIAFMSGIIGRFFFQFGVTVAVAVLVSLFVSFTLDPMLSSVWHDPPGIALQARARGSAASWSASSTSSSGCIASTAGSSNGRSRTGRACSPFRWSRLFGSFALVPLIGTEFVPRNRPGLHFAAAQHAGWLEPRVHGRQGAAGRGRRWRRFPRVGARR